MGKSKLEQPGTIDTSLVNPEKLKRFEQSAHDLVSTINDSHLRSEIYFDALEHLVERDQIGSLMLHGAQLELDA